MHIYFWSICLCIKQICNNCVLFLKLEALKEQNKIAKQQERAEKRKKEKEAASAEAEPSAKKAKQAKKERKVQKRLL